MSIILEFNEEEKQQLINTWTKSFSVGHGEESICYKIDDYVYKVLNNQSKPHYDNSICNNEMKVSSFLFPEEIYTSNDEIFAYKTKYTRNEIDDKRISAGVLPDINKIKDALPSFIRDLIILSKNNIIATDLSWRNLLFDGEKLYAIDTLNYARIGHNPTNTYIKNITCLVMAIMTFTKAYEDACAKKSISLSEDEIKLLRGLPSYVVEAARQMQKENIDEIIQK